MNVNIFDKIKENYSNFGLSQIVVLPTDDGIDNVKFIINNDIIKVKHGIQKHEISQIFLFNKEVSNEILKLSKNYNRFDILYKHIIPNNNIMAIKCFKNEVVNINTESDLRKIKR